jgi:Flp pilus assembly protein TadG
MTQRTERGRRHRRGRGDDGAAVVEFAFIMTLLFTLIFGIITFGLLLSFKQDMTRAAAEGARAGAVAASGEAAADATAATEEAVRQFSDRFSSDGCATAGMTCTPPLVGDCSPGSVEQCVTVELIYDYDAEPFIVPVPLISAFLPDTVEARSVARINE